MTNTPPTQHPRPLQPEHRGPTLPGLEPGLAVKVPLFLRRLLVTCLLLVLPVILLAGAWRLGGVSALEDDLLYYFPVKQFIGQQLARGNFPTWNPLAAMGTTIAADPQAGLWYPPTWLFAILPPFVAYSLNIILHFALAGAGMYRFLRTQHLDWRAALLAAIAFEFSGFLVAHRVHLTMLQSAAWLPWMLYAWHRLAITRKNKYAIFAALITALQLLVQHAQVSMISLALLAAYTVTVLVPRNWSLLYRFPLATVAGILIALIQIIPTWLHFAHSGRSTPAWYLFVENSYVPTSALMFIFPMFYGARTPNLWDQPWWGVSHFCEQSAYASIIILLLAIASLRLLRYRREIIFWWAAMLIALLLALGKFTPLSDLLFHIPVYRNFRVPARWILVWSTGLPVLAAYVLSATLRHNELTTSATKGIRLAAKYIIPTFTAVFLLLMLLAYFFRDWLHTVITGYYADTFLTGLDRALRITNPAIWWPVLLVIVTIWITRYWLQNPNSRRLYALFILLLVDLASVASFVDIDTRTYTLSDLQNPPPLAETIKEMNPQPGHRLLVPRYHASYHRPVEVLWPQTNMLFDIPVFNGYGPFWPQPNRALLRFMPWGSSEHMLTLLRNHRLLQTFGVRFIAVRSAEEQKLLDAALLPDLQQPETQSIPAARQIKPVRYGHDLLWPVTVDKPGIYELTFRAEPVKNSPSRWYLRLEDQNATAVTGTRTLEPVDLALGPRKMYFTFHVTDPPGPAYLRVKAETAHALSAGQATFARVAGPDGTGLVRPYKRQAERPNNVTLYELPDANKRFYAPRKVTCTHNLRQSVKLLKEQPEQLGLPHAAVIHNVQTSLIEDPADRPNHADERPPGEQNASRKEMPKTRTSAPASPQPQSMKEMDRDRQPVASATQTAGPAPEITVNMNRLAPGHYAGKVYADRPGWIVFNQAIAPAWQATLDNEPVTIHPANALTMAVHVPPGAHTLNFQYQPYSSNARYLLFMPLILLALPFIRVAATNPKRNR